MHKTSAEASAAREGAEGEVKTQAQVAVAPPFTALAGSRRRCGARHRDVRQNCHYEKQGGVHR